MQSGCPSIKRINIKMLNFIIWKADALFKDPLARFSFKQQGDPISIGSSELADIMISSKFLSRIHAIIETKEQKVIIQDNDSVNGIYFIKDDFVEKIRRERLSKDSLIAIGDFIVLIKGMELQKTEQSDSEWIKYESSDNCSSDPTMINFGPDSPSSDRWISYPSPAMLALLQGSSAALPSLNRKQTIENLHQLAMDLGYLDQPVIPTLVSLRSALINVFPLIADFDAFLVDNYPDVHREVANGMSRTEKVNLLFQRVTAAEIIAVVQENYEDKYGAFKSYFKFDKRSIFTRLLGK